MKVRDLIAKLSEHPLDMKVVGSSDKHDHPAEIYVSYSWYRKDVSEWACEEDKRGEKVVTLEVSY